MGCGPQEQFYGCSDIKITDGSSVQSETTKPQAVVTNSNQGVAIWGQCNN